MGLFDAIASTAANLTDNIFGAIQTNHQNKVNQRMMREQNEFNAQEAQKARDWQKEFWDMNNEYNSPAAMIARGLNPFMSGSAASSASSAPSSSPQATGAVAPSAQAFLPNFSSVASSIASFAQAKNLYVSADNKRSTLPYLIDQIRGSTDYRNIAIGDSGYWNKNTGRISAELDQSLERQRLYNAVQAGKLSAAQTSQIYLQSDAQQILNRYMDANQQADLFTKSQYLYNLVQQGALTEKQIKTELQRAILVSAQASGQKISNKVASGTADALLSATNMSYYTQYYDSLWDYKNVNHRKNMEYSRNKAIRDYYRWNAGNAKKDFDSYGLRNTLEYGTRVFTGTGNTVGTLEKAFPPPPPPIKGFGR
uniref:DNA pilot protein n=1 Tax=Dulem virus 243 TaxID=3145720 RepID=A0AAU8ATE1_9VIRU